MHYFGLWSPREIGVFKRGLGIFLAVIHLFMPSGLWSLSLDRWKFFWAMSLPRGILQAYTITQASRTGRCLFAARTASGAATRVFNQSTRPTNRHATHCLRDILISGRAHSSPIHANALHSEADLRWAIFCWLRPRIYCRSVRHARSSTW